MRLIPFLLLFLSLPLWSTTYSIRLNYIEEMARYFPGFTSKSTLGVMGGIYVQTEWQEKTGRSHIPAWATINEYLTVHPYKYFQNYLIKGRTACRNMACLAWMDFFEYTDIRIHGFYGTSLQKIKSNKLLWTAHEEAIAQALSDHPRLLTGMQTPPSERRYLTGWIRFVHVLATSRMPTNEYFVRLLAKPTSPPCAPLGAPDCRIRDLVPTSQIFVSKMIVLSQLDNKLPEKTIRWIIDYPPHM